MNICRYPVLILPTGEAWAVFTVVPEGVGIVLWAVLWLAWIVRKSLAITVVVVFRSYCYTCITTNTTNNTTTSDGEFIPSKYHFHGLLHRSHVRMRLDDIPRSSRVGTILCIVHIGLTSCWRITSLLTGEGTIVYVSGLGQAVVIRMGSIEDEGWTGRCIDQSWSRTRKEQVSIILFVPAAALTIIITPRILVVLVLLQGLAHWADRVGGTTRNLTTDGVAMVLSVWKTLVQPGRRVVWATSIRGCIASNHDR
jgi:hypothetical protein